MTNQYPTPEMIVKMFEAAINAKTYKEKDRHAKELIKMLNKQSMVEKTNDLPST